MLKALGWFDSCERSATLGWASKGPERTSEGRFGDKTPISAPWARFANEAGDITNFRLGAADAERFQPRNHRSERQVSAPHALQADQPYAKAAIMAEIVRKGYRPGHDDNARKERIKRVHYELAA